MQGTAFGVLILALAVLAAVVVLAVVASRRSARRQRQGATANPPQPVTPTAKPVTDAGEEGQERSG